MMERSDNSRKFIEAKRALTSESDPAYQRTVVLIKPLGVARGIVGKVISRFEDKMLNIEALRVVQIERDQAEKYYEVHKGKFFFESLVEELLEGPSAIIAVGGGNSIEVIKNMTGKTRPFEAEVGTIRGDFGYTSQEPSIGHNLLGVSDAPITAKEHLELFFPHLKETSR